MNKIVVGIIVLSLALVGCSAIKTTECEVRKECPAEKALLIEQLGQWGLNQEDEGEYLFRYSVTNYGKVEAKAVKIICYIKEGETVVVDKEFEVGNIGSESYVYKDAAIKFGAVSDYAIGGCYIISCDNCEILNRRIPDYMEGVPNYGGEPE